MSWTLPGTTGSPAPVSPTTVSVAAVQPGPGATVASSVRVFGPQRYVRTTGAPNVYRTVVNVPPWVRSPFRLAVRNGETDGSCRVSAGWIEINQTRVVAAPRDFNQKVAGFERSVTLTPQTVLTVTLASAPCSVLTIELFGEGSDRTPPRLTIAEPLPDAAGNNRTPRLLLRYADPSVDGKPASGVDARTLQVWLDDVDRTSLFTVSEDQATALVPSSLALGDGLHRLRATVSDRAGNVAEAAAGFLVDTVAPMTAVELPANGAYLAASRPLLRVGYRDEGAPPSGVDVASVRVSVDATDRTAELAVTASQAEGTLPQALADGPHTVRVEVADAARNAASAAASFMVDTRAPVISGVEPAEGSYHADLGSGGTLQMTGTIDDLDPAPTVQCRVRDTSVAGALATGRFSCDVPLIEGVNAVEVRAIDRAGHESSVIRHLQVDTLPPQVAVVYPGEGEYTAAQSLDVTGGVIDASPVTVRVADTLAVVTGAEFRAAAVPVGDGPEVTLHVVARDAAGNEGATAVTVRVDRSSPRVLIASPAAAAYLRGPFVDVSGSVEDASPVLVEVNDQTADVTGSTFTAQVPVADGPVTLRASARDAAGNLGTAERAVAVDSVPPVITVTEPAQPAVTRAPSLRVAGTVADVSPVAFSIDGAPAPLSGGAFAVEVSLPAEGPRTVVLSATDAAGNVGQTAFEILVDRVAPDLSVASPAPGLVVAALPVVVQGLVSDQTEVAVTVDGVAATVTGQAWQAAFPSLPEGPHVFTIEATDGAGNAATVTRSVIVDLGPPVVAILAPASGALTRNPVTTVTGTVSDHSAVSVTVNGADAIVTGAGSFSFERAGVALSEGDNRLVARATDATGRTGEAEVMVTRDSAPPVVELLAPDTVSRHRAGTLSVAASDNLGLERVTLRVDGTLLAEFSSGPYQAELSVPAGAHAGDSLTVTAEATDRAWNTASVSRVVRVAAEGVVVGQVLSDATGLPLPGATVRSIGGAGEASATVTDERGRYSLSAQDDHLMLIAEKDGMTAVERGVTVATGVGTVPVDARLTPVADPVAIPADGGVVTLADRLDLTAPAGAFATATDVRLTRLSAQGLPGLLPLGWSPLMAFELRAASPLHAPLVGTAKGIPGPAHLVTYRPTTHAWTMVEPGLEAGAEGIGFNISEPGVYALVVPDPGETPMAVPSVGEALSGVEMVLLPLIATSTGVVTPSTVPPSGGTATGTVVVHSPVPVPSGTVVQAEVAETFQLASGEVASEETRVQDVLVFRVPSTGESEGPTGMAADFPITPSQAFGIADLVEGKVHLDILAGREAVRGRTGGNEAVVLEAGEARVSVPAQALATDTAMSIEVTGLSSFLPTGSGLVPLSEVVLDFSGHTLDRAAELSIQSTSVSPDDTLLIVRVERVEGIPVLTVVAVAVLVGDRIVSQPTPGLPGVTRGGRYVVYRSGPIGFVQGTVSSSAGPAKAILRTDVLPFVALSAADGRFTLAASVGVAVVTAQVPRTSLRANELASVSEGETTQLDLLLSGAVTAAEVSPVDGALGIPTDAQVQITTASPLYPATVTAANVRLLREGQSGPVAVRLFLSGSGRTLAVIPVVRLAFSTEYRLEASGLADVHGGGVVVPPVAFTTAAEALPVHNTGALTFSFPDADGTVTVSAPPGSLPAGAVLLIINAANGVVLSLTAFNDGSVTGELPASISDRLLVTITDPSGNSTNFERSTFVAPDGRVAVGAGGGTIEGPGGLEARIPAGALDAGVVMRLEPFTPDPDDAQPNLGADESGAPLAHFGHAMRIEAPDRPVFKKEVKLAFPLPDFSTLPENERPARPEDAFYYVYRRIDGPDGKPAAYQILDHAFVEGVGDQRKVVMASPPFEGYTNSFGAFDPTGGIAATTFNVAYMMWSLTSFVPVVATPGGVIGKVLQTVWDPDAVQPNHAPVVGAIVSAVDEDGNPLSTPPTITRTQADGRFMLLDGHYRGGQVRLKVEYQGEARYATAYETLRAEWARYDWGVFESSLKFYNVIATANVVFPADEPPAPPPVIGIRVMRKLADGTRQDTNGLAVAGSPLVIGFTTGPTVTVDSATVQGHPYNVRGPLAGDPSGFTYLLEDPGNPDGSYTPALPGTYTVAARAVNQRGDALGQSSTFRVIAPGGDQREPLPGEPPRIITAQTVPKDAAGGVPASTFLQVVFSEPVTRVPGNVSLVEVLPSGSDGPTVALQFSGIGRQGEPLAVVTDTDVVTSLTIQPATGLKFAQTYRLTLRDGIIDRDSTPRKLASCRADVAGNPLFTSPLACQTSFTTFGPQAVGGTGDFGSPGIVVLGNRAFLVHSNFFSGSVRVFDLTDPVQPEESAASGTATVTGMPVDIAGDGTTLVVGTGPSSRGPMPANVYVFDVSNEDRVRWVGVSSVTSSTVDGFIARLAVKGDFAYSLTTNRGIQVVDLEEAKAVFEAETQGTETSVGYRRMVQKLNTDRQGVGQQATIATIEVRTAAGADVRLVDLEVADYDVDGGVQPVVVATGDLPLVIASPQSAAVVWQGRPADDVLSLTYGQALALTRLANVDVALIAGYGSSAAGLKPVLAVVSLADLRAPTLLSYVDLSKEPCLSMIYDVAVKDNLALVGTKDCVVLVNVADPTLPFLAGSLPGAGGRLALTDTGLLLSTARLPAGNPDPLGGIKTATFAPLAAILPVRPTLAKVIQDGSVTKEETLTDILLNLRVYPDDYPVTDVMLQLFSDGVPLGAPLPVAIVNGMAVRTLQKGFQKLVDSAITAVMSFLAEGTSVPSPPRLIDIGSITITLDSNNDTIVDDKDDRDVRDDPNKDDPQKALRFAFWDGDKNRSGEDALVDYATVRLRLKAPLASDERIGLYLPSADWDVHLKVQPSDFPTLLPAPPQNCVTEGKLYLCNAAAAKLQVVRNAAPEGNLTPRAIGGGLIEIPAVLLKRGDNEFLFSCKPRDDGSPGCPSEMMQAVQITGSTSSKLDERRAEIRPLKNWMSVYSVRQSGTFQPAASAQPVLGWVPQVPENTGQVTIILHGFNVSGEVGVDTFLPTYFKRLYWAGSPVHARQCDTAASCAHSVGFIWPGDQGFLGIPLSAGLMYPEDEFHALQAGVPFSSFVKDIIKPKAQRVRVIAHSLGNMVVNSALMQPGMDQHIERYVMNEAAVAAEAFDANYSYDAEERAVMVPHAVRHGFSPDLPTISDGVWRSEWLEMEQGIPFRCVPDPVSATNPPMCSPDHGDRDAWLSLLARNSGVLAQPSYTRRWNQCRPPIVCSDSPDGAPDPGRGPWRGYFAGTLDRGTTILNTFNSEDQVLKVEAAASIDLRPALFSAGCAIVSTQASPVVVSLASLLPAGLELRAWYTSQRIQKPRLLSPLGSMSCQEILLGRLDDRGRRFWATLGVDLAAANYLWSGVNHANTTRQWAELAFWFPALSRAAGSRPLAGMLNEDFGSYGRPDPISPVGVNTHGYMTLNPFSVTWGGYRRIETFFREGK